MAETEKKYYHIASLEKGIRVLELLAERQELTVTQTARELGLNRASSHRFLAHLCDLGYVEKSDDSRYRLSLKLLELGTKSADRFEIRRQARSSLQELFLAFRETVNLGYWTGLDVLHLDKIDSLDILRMDTPLGSRAPAYCTGLGKAILAHLPAEELESYLAYVELTPHGPNTILSKEDLHRELAETKQRGYALDDEELSPGLRCVAGPIFDHSGRARYALSVSGPTARLAPKNIDRVQQKVREVCDRLSVRLSHGRP